MGIARQTNVEEFLGSVRAIAPDLNELQLKAILEAADEFSSSEFEERDSFNRAEEATHPG